MKSNDPGHIDPVLQESIRKIRLVAFDFDGVFTDNNLGSKPEYLRKLCRALRPIEKIWSAAVSVDVTYREIDEFSLRT